MVFRWFFSIYKCTQINFVLFYYLANLQRLGHEVKVAEDNLRKELSGKFILKCNMHIVLTKLNGSANSHDLEIATTNLAATKIELGNTKSAIADLTKKQNGKINKKFNCAHKTNKIIEISFHTDRTSDIEDIGRMPRSCADLQRMGQKISGFFFIAGIEKIEIVYCDFFPNKNGTTTMFFFTIYCHL